MTTEPQPAAIVILVRPSAEGRFETLLVRRHPGAPFMPAADVFPGGRIEPGESAAAAAARELLEEAGVLVAPGATPESATRIRAGLRQRRAAFAELLQDEGLQLEPSLLLPWAHWITPSAEPRRFSAQFFLAEMPGGQQATCDDEETTELEWVEPVRALASHAGGAMRLPPPTHRSVEELAEVPSLAALRAQAAGRSPLAPILPKLVALDGAEVLLLPWDPDYAAAAGEGLAIPSGHPVARGASRIVLPDGRFWATPRTPPRRS